MSRLDGDAAAPKAARTRQRILDAAAQQFRERGYANTRLTDIAAAAGIRTGSLYYHFASREALVGEILHVGMDTARRHVHDVVERLDAGVGPLERLAAAIRAHMDVVLDISVFASAQSRVVNEVPDDIRRAHLDEQRAYGEYWQDLLAAAQDAGDIDPSLDLYLARVMLFGSMNATVGLRTGTRSADHDPATVAEAVVRMILHGLAVPRDVGSEDV